jgi:hypothetical protein
MHKHHIIPKHMGGSDDPLNIESITIEEHAERHRLLFEAHGHWQDEVAWKGLTKQITCEEATKLAQKAPKSEQWKRNMSERMKGAGNPRYGKAGTMRGISMNQESRNLMAQKKASKWEITTPSGTKEVISNLCEYSRQHGLQQTNMVQVAKGTHIQHKGYRCKKICDK